MNEIYKITSDIVTSLLESFLREEISEEEIYNKILDIRNSLGGKSVAIEGILGDIITYFDTLPEYELPNKGIVRDLLLELKDKKGL